MQFISSLDTYASDQTAKNIWSHYHDILKEIDGICYYKHPIITAPSSVIPDLSLLSRGYEPLAIKYIDCELKDIIGTDDGIWKLNSGDIDSPLLELEDMLYGLRHKFDSDRRLRRLLKPVGALFLPLINRKDFIDKFGELEHGENIIIVWADFNISSTLIVNDKLSGDQWLLSKSIYQGANPLNVRDSYRVPDTSDKIGEAINILEKDIALLDEEQHKVAVQMAPGPQRIRGLAGTGKTVVLAMKAANIHLRYPNKRILFTFHTQSLYNQTKELISKFYRAYSDGKDPEWKNLHIRHGWGSRNRPGVYYDLCKKLSILPFTLRTAKSYDPVTPFRACCRQVLEKTIEPSYDYILIDEAQDFPIEFFRILRGLITEEKRIYWAYDELQSLSAREMPTAEELFGEENGKPFISLEGEDYPGDIEKDFVLHKSYRCPLEILMLAHAVGLGIHAPRGCVQMLENKISWQATGYKIEKGELKEGEETIIYRPPENSPNRIGSIYSGHQKIVDYKSFDDRGKELGWVALSIVDNIKNDGVRPEDIIVISLDAISARGYFSELQSFLQKQNIASTIPGLVDESWEFAEEGFVTLSSFYRAKGNEAPLIYIISFDSLYTYAEEIESRNRAFTSISRAKGFIRITGTGIRMNSATKEIEEILSDIPRFKFIFPNMENIRKLDASETSRRRREVRRAKESINALLDLDEEALTDLDIKKIKKLRKKIAKVPDED